MAKFKVFYDDNVGRTVTLCNEQVDGVTCLEEVDIDNVCPSFAYHDDFPGVYTTESGSESCNGHCEFYAGRANYIDRNCKFHNR